MCKRNRRHHCRHSPSPSSASRSSSFAFSPRSLYCRRCLPLSTNSGGLKMSERAARNGGGSILFVKYTLFMENHSFVSGWCVRLMKSFPHRSRCVCMLRLPFTLVPTTIMIREPVCVSARSLGRPPRAPPLSLGASVSVRPTANAQVCAHAFILIFQSKSHIDGGQTGARHCVHTILSVYKHILSPLNTFELELFRNVGWRNGERHTLISARCARHVRP